MPRQNEKGKREELTIFYRYSADGGRIPMDFDGTYEGETLFIAGGAPSLADEPNLDRLAEPGINVLAINNTAATLDNAMNLWLGSDKPKCYSDRILKDPRIMKFAMISRKDLDVGGTPWKQLPNTFFFGTCDKFTNENFLMPHRDFVWWKNTFYIALQIARRLGFKKVYLVGCSFQISKDKQYSYDIELTGPETEWNQRVYGKTVDRLKLLKPVLDAGGLEVISATPDSMINDDYPAVTFDAAIDDALKDFPADYKLHECVHSSALKKTG